MTQRSKTGPKAIPAIDRLNKMVDRGDSCHIFTGCTNAKGYGKVGVPGRGTQYAHRIMWEHHNGPIPDGLIVMHTCDTPACVNIKHLVLGTKADNNQDMANKGRHWNQKKTQCPKGHKYTDENTYVKPSDGGRQCRICESNRIR